MEVKRLKDVEFLISLQNKLTSFIRESLSGEEIETFTQLIEQDDTKLLIDILAKSIDNSIDILAKSIDNS